MALGARAADVLGLVLREGAAPAPAEEHVELLRSGQYALLEGACLNLPVAAHAR